MMIIAHKQLEVSGILLAGGRSRRFFADKALALVEGEPLLDRSLGKLRACCREAFIVSSDGKRYPGRGATEIADLHPGMGPLGGILTGLLKASCEYCFVVACDMPYWHRKVVERLLSAAEGRDGAVPRRTDGRIEPLLAVYSRRCAHSIERSIGSGDLKAGSFYEGLDIRYFPASELVDPPDEAKLFTNINTPEDYRALSRRNPGRGAGEDDFLGGEVSR